MDGTADAKGNTTITTTAATIWYCPVGPKGTIYCPTPTTVGTCPGHIIMTY